jgi:hypothetical protein
MLKDCKPIVSPIDFVFIYYVWMVLVFKGST